MVDGGEESPPALNRASQKITVAAILLRAMPEPSTPEGRNLRKEAQALLEDAAVQQAESSVSRMRLTRAGVAAQQDREVSVHTPTAGGTKAPMVHDRVMLPPAKERLRGTRDNAYDGYACNILNQKKKDDAVHVYHPQHGGRYDSKEDRSPSPEPPGHLCVQPGNSRCSVFPTLSAAHHPHQILGRDGSRALSQRLPLGMSAGQRD